MSVRLKIVYPIFEEKVSIQEEKDFPNVQCLFDIDDKLLYDDEIKNIEHEKSDDEPKTKDEKKSEKERIKAENKLEKERIKAEKIKEKETIKAEKIRQKKEGRKCQWKIKSGIRIGMLCGNPVAGGDLKGGEDFCRECLNKTTLKVKLSDNNISPTLTRLKTEVEKSPKTYGDLFSRIEFTLEDYYEVYQRKTGQKLIRNHSCPILKNLSYHWKFIIEVITSNKEFLFQMAAILKMASEGRIKILKDKSFWLRESNDFGWMKSDKEECISKVKIFKDAFILTCLNTLHSLPLSEHDNMIEITEICDKIKSSFEVKISKEVIDNFLHNIVDKETVLEEHPIGERFMRERLEFTKDNKFHGITTNILAEQREKWIKENPGCNLQSYNSIQLGKLLSQNKLWETDIGRSRIKRHLGIKLKT